MNRKKVLMIVDDDIDDRFFFRNAVQELGEAYEYREAGQGIEALECLCKADTLPDFIFLDLNMPLMDGKTCLAELKKDEKLKNIPVIIYTTSTYGEDKEFTDKLGAAYYLVKPYNASILAEEIKKAMKQVEEVTLREKKP